MAEESETPTFSGDYDDSQGSLGSKRTPLKEIINPDTGEVEYRLLTKEEIELEKAEEERERLADKPPLKDPAKMLEWLRRHNPNYTYSNDITPEMMRRALEWAEAKGFDPTKLGEAQILFAQDWEKGKPTRVERAAEEIEKRRRTLKKHKESLKDILLSEKDTWVHATPQVHINIFKHGLLCNQRFGLDGVAIRLKKYVRDNQNQEDVIAQNIHVMADSHRNYRYLVIVRLPDLTEEQKKNLATGKNREVFFIKPINVTNTRGAGLEYDALLPSEYILGYVDLDTGKFTSKEEALKNPNPQDLILT